jgi:O-antigen/teichoic acid export membrane protein
LINLNKKLFRESVIFLKKPIELLSFQIAELFISLISSILLIRLLNSNLYGLFVYLSSFLALTSLIFGQLDNFIIRFSNIKESSNAIKNFYSSIYNKLAWFTIILLGCLIYLFIFKEEEFNRYGHLIILISFNNFLTIFNGSFSATLTAFKKQIYLSRISLFSVCFELLIILIFFLSDILNVLTSFLVLKTLIAVVQIIIKGIYIDNLDIKLWMPKNAKITLPWNKKHSKYTVPLIATSLFTYLKNYLPNIILGSISSYNNVSYYNIFFKIFNLANKILPKLSSSFLPEAIELKSANKYKFQIRYFKFSILYFFIVLLGSASLYFSKDLILWLYDFKSIKSLNLGIFLMCLATLFHSLSTIMTFFYFTGERTFNILFVEVIRSFIMVFTSYYLIIEFQLLGAFFSFFLHNLITFVLLFIFSFKRIKIFYSKKLFK